MLVRFQKNHQFGQIFGVGICVDGRKKGLFVRFSLSRRFLTCQERLKVCSGMIISGNRAE